jgi:hypothetical protein
VIIKTDIELIVEGAIRTYKYFLPMIILKHRTLECTRPVLTMQTIRLRKPAKPDSSLRVVVQNICEFYFTFSFPPGYVKEMTP